MRNTQSRCISRHINGQLLLLAMLVGSLPVQAADLSLLAGQQFDPGVEISASSQWPPGNFPTAEPGDSLDLDDGPLWAVALNIPFQGNSDQRVGLFYSRHSTEFNPAAGLANPDLDISYLHFIGTNFYPQGERLSFFALAGLGATFFQTSDASLRDVTRFSMQIGAGATVELTSNVLLQMEMRWLPTFFGGDASVFCSGGCTVSVSADTMNQFQMNAGLMFRF